MTRKPLRSRTSGALVAVSLFLLLLSAGCSSTSGGVKSPANPPSGASIFESTDSVGALDVGLDEEALPPELVDLANRYELTRRLDDEVRGRLAGRLSGGGDDLQVNVRVIGARLRSNGTAIWWGVMAGGDWLTVDVEVTQGGQTVKQFQTGTSTALGGFAFGGLTTRINRMVGTLSKRIVEGL